MDDHYVKSARSGEPEGAAYAAHIDNPTDFATPSAQSPTGTWSTGLFGCFTDVVPNCAMVTFCPCVSVAQVASKLEVMEKFSAKVRLTPYWLALAASLVVVVGQYVMLALFINQVAEILTSDSVVWGLYQVQVSPLGRGRHVVHLPHPAGVCYVLFSIQVWQLRTETPREFQIRGNWVEDCWSSLWCPCCALAQTATQARSYMPGSCSFGPPPVGTLLPYSQH